MRELSALTLGKIAYRNLIFIIPFAILGLLLGSFVSSKATPMFRASADLFISTPASTFDIGLIATGSTFSQERVKSYTQILSAPATLQPVIDKLELNTTPQALATRISAAAPPDTVVIRLSVVDENPGRAAAIANEVGAQFSLTAETIELTQLDLTSPVKISLARPAVPEYAPISPKKKTNQLLGSVSLALLCYIFFLVKFFLDSTVKNVRDLGNLSLLAAIGFDPSADKNPLISEIGPYDARTEHYRTLRTNFLNSTESKFPLCVAVVSGVAEEGKTTTALNLAISLSNLGLDCLLIEGDLRRPRFDQYFALDSVSKTLTKEGLTDLLSTNSRAQLMKALPKAINVRGEHISFIHCGEIRTNSTELLSNDRFGELMSYVKKKYQIVIIDCPPVLPVIDASVICQSVDGAIVITYGGKTKTKSFTATVDILNQVGVRIFGVVINKIPSNREAEDYGYISGYATYHRKGYNYFRKKRGYIPYGPYSSLESPAKGVRERPPIIPGEQSNDSPKNFQSANLEASKKRRLFRTTRKSSSQVEITTHIDPEIEELISKWDLGRETQSKSVVVKSLNKKARKPKLINPKKSATIRKNT
jgi:succinoglycan biosynthesis transport protein ExoP